jgi:CRISPR-associated protein Csm1
MHTMGTKKLYEQFRQIKICKFQFFLNFGILNQQGKIAKGLCARSFYVQMLSQIASHKILHAFQLPMTNVLSSAGGNFTLVIPALKDGHIRLKNLRDEMERWCFQHFRGELNLVIHWLSVSGRQMNDNQAFAQLKQEGYRSKHAAYSSMLQESGKWAESHFLSFFVGITVTAVIQCFKISPLI